MAAPRIGLFGYYGQDNFGDDLMAVLFSTSLRNAGVPTCVYRYRSPVLPGEIETADTLVQLVEASDVIVYGGGGLLIPQPESSPFSRTVGRLLDLCTSRGTPLYCLSIGGSGLAPDSELIPRSRRELVRAARYRSFRDPREAAMSNQRGLNGEWFQDVVWTTPLFYLPAHRPPDRTRAARILVNLYPKAEERIMLDRVFERIAVESGGSDWHFVETHTFGPEHVQVFRPQAYSDRFHFDQFTDVSHGVSYVQECDLVITNRLHVSIVAMSFGIPCIAMLPTPKARNCFQHLQLQGLCWDTTRIKSVTRLDDPQKLQEITAPFFQLARDSIIENARMHLQRLHEICAKAATSARTSLPPRAADARSGADGASL